MRVLVTGAGRAIGATTVKELLNGGHEVVATARDVSLVEALGATLALPLDVTNEASINETLAKAGDIDAVVNNAALQGTAPLEDFPLPYLRSMFETNAIGPLHLIQKLIPRWRERGNGVIVNVSSVQGRVASPLEGSYAATKFALEAISETLHYELGHFGIRVVIIEPGFISPGMKQTSEDLPQPPVYQQLYDEWSDTDTKVTGPGGRPGPEVVGRAILKAIEDHSTPLRVPVGGDAELILGMRSAVDDATFEATMRATLGLTW